MEPTLIFTAIGQGIDLIKSLANGIINYLSKGKVDQSELNKLRFEYDTAVQNLTYSIKQAELLLAEKMMVGASWIKPLALTTGISIVTVCSFNIVCNSLNFSNYSLQIDSTEMLVLLGMFMYVTSGSSKALLSIIDWLISRLSTKKVKPSDSDNKTQGV